MKTPISYLLVASTELDDAIDWYEKKSSGLGSRFNDAVEALLNQIANQPNLYPVAIDDVRQAIVKKFPYTVIFRVFPDAILVIAIIHTSRDPAIWQSRV